ncbi:uncharacterized protein LOC134535904 [Bacillus rossius redtenbacheri]|uniref:uncharacterized protein LOC134530538 n=1 Tax=Bacillus rossius redtenbacheri TaxID=93214 RepID=UPI002FDDF7F3
MNHRVSGNSDAADLMKKITETPTRASKIKTNLLSNRNSVKKHNPSEALSIFVQAELTKQQYQVIYSANKNVYSCYSLLTKAKKECYPSKDSIVVSETKAEVKLQSLLDHISSRLCKYLEEVLQVLSSEEKPNLELISKWGCDGSQQTQFKQKFENIADSDANIFQSSCVPIKLIANNHTEKKIIWQNPTPSSTRFCRPIRIRFVHETADVTLHEIKYIQEQIKTLKETEVPSFHGAVKIRHTLLLTMVDGKVCNAATGTTSTMRCYICGSTSKDVNKLCKDFTENPNTLTFGLSPLQTRIRFLESILRLSYRIPISIWQAISKEQKRIVADTKMNIQKMLKDELGLLVDVPKQGFGTTNDGNTSRRFFAEPDTASRITGVNVELIKSLKVILEAISSGHHIDETKFHKYAYETAKLYVSLYSWHPMIPTMHKVLLHGAAVFKEAILPIGQLSEEAAEARNKHFRMYRTKYSRKFNREVCNRDVLNRLLLTSDPFLSCSTQRRRKTTKPYSSETLELLLPEMAEIRSTKRSEDGCDEEAEYNYEEAEENRSCSSEDSD